MFQNPATVNALEAMTDFVAFEKLCCDLLALYGGYQGIVPQGVGRIDGGKDAILVRRDSEDVTVVRQKVVFHFSLRKHYERKLWEDLCKARARGIPADLVVFLTSREVTPSARDKLQSDAKAEFGWTIEIHDQQWLRVALEGEFQRLRKQYLGIDYDPRVFHDLESLLDLPERHPNREDLEQGAYYRNEALHDRIHALLDTQRRCLVLGKPGHGKTALAKAVGWELLSHDAGHAVFFVHAGIGPGYERWLYHINAFDHDWVTFILDDCHRAPEQVRALLDAWPDVCKARLVLVSRPLDAAAGANEENFQKALEDVRVDVDPDEVTIGRIIERILQRGKLTLRDPGPLDAVMVQCRGDLHILEFLVRAWQQQPPGVVLSKVPDYAILDDVYARYLGGPREPHRQHIAAIAALSEFEIPVESRWLGDAAAVATLRVDSFVECFTEKIEGVPAEFLRYFHSTPARYVVHAAHRKGILGSLVPDEFVLNRLAAYVRCGPTNLFEVFSQLKRNARHDFTARLFSDGAVMAAVENFIRLAPQVPSEAWLEGYVDLACEVCRWERGTATVTRKVLDAFERRLPAETRGTLWASVRVGALRRFVLVLHQEDLGLANEVLGGLDYAMLGECSSDLGIRGIIKFWDRSQKARVSKENLNTFCNGLDFRKLGERSRDSALPQLVKFIVRIRQAKVSVEKFTTFFSRLDWRRLGQQMPGIDEGPPLWTFHTVTSNPGITVEMGREFVEGMGWDLVRSNLSVPSGPDVVAALRAMLMQKCRYDRTDLKQRGVDFTSDTWLRSFVERGCGKVVSVQERIQRKYLQLALNALKGYPSRPLGERLRRPRLTLRNWTILIHNLKLADPEFLRSELEPLLRDMSPAEWARLIREADLLNLGIFAGRFAPDGGDFAWRPHLDPALGEPDFDAILGPASLSEIAHPLFTLQYLGKPDWCAAIADALDRDPGNVLAKMAGTDLRTLEFFLWNLLTARHTLSPPALLDSLGIGSEIGAIGRRGADDQENLAALCGTLYLWGWRGLNELLPLVDRESALAHCLTAARLKGVKLIRLAAGLAALAPAALPAAGRDAIRQGLGSLVFPLEVPTQVLALERVRAWIESVPAV